jgi:hypothetical protein
MPLEKDLAIAALHIDYHVVGVMHNTNQTLIDSTIIQRMKDGSTVSDFPYLWVTGEANLSPPL